MMKEIYDYLNDLKKQVNERNRKNIQNITNFMKEETQYWERRLD